MIAYVRVIDGGFAKRQLVSLMRTDQDAEIEELGYFGPEMKPTDRLETGEVGYIITGVKDVAQVHVGDTITDKKRPAGEALPGYKVVQPMVFTGLFPTEGDKFEELRDALEKLKLNDAALTYEPESSVALGFGFRCGFLGLLHMDIVRERLEREYDLELITTMPNVEYHAYLTNGKMTVVRNPAQMPEVTVIDHIEEPFVSASILVPTEFVGTIMELCQGRRADFVDMKYLSPRARGDALQAAAGRDRARLLRPAQDAHARLRLARLRVLRLPAERPGEARHPARRRAGGRALADHAARTRAPARQGAGDQAAPEDPAPAVRGRPCRRRSATR